MPPLGGGFFVPSKASDFLFPSERNWGAAGCVSAAAMKLRNVMIQSRFIWGSEF